MVYSIAFYSISAKYLISRRGRRFVLKVTNFAPLTLKRSAVNDLILSFCIFRMEYDGITSKTSEEGGGTIIYVIDLLPKKKCNVPSKYLPP